jgi:hypothetical protein
MAITTICGNVLSFNITGTDPTDKEELLEQVRQLQLKYSDHGYVFERDDEKLPWVLSFEREAPASGKPPSVNTYTHLRDFVKGRGGHSV